MTVLPLWVEPLKIRLRHHPIVIVFGNVHDRFPAERGTAQLFHEVLAEAAKMTGSVPCVISAADQEKSGQKLIGQIEAALKARAAEPHWFICEDLQSIFPRSREEWRLEDWQLHRRFIDLLQAQASFGHRFILTFPSEARVPLPFLAGVPGVVRFQIPLPSQEEREAWAKPYADRSESSPEASRRLAGLTDGVQWDDLQRLGMSLGNAGSATDLEGAVRTFRYGVSKDPWAELLKEPYWIQNARGKIVEGEDPLVGQESSVDKALKVLAKAALNFGSMTTTDYRRPRGVLFFVGPTGVGKTMLAKKLARILFGSAEACVVLDMSEYSTEHSEARLIGAPPGYIGYDEGGQLTSAVREKPFSIVLFDEIDKANSSIFKKFLQILDEGRLTDGKGQTCLFTETILIFTSNWGASHIREGSTRISTKDGGEIEIPGRHASDEELLRYYSDVLRTNDTFKAHPEILGRIGLSNIVPFKHIDAGSEALKALRRMMQNVSTQLRNQPIKRSNNATTTISIDFGEEDEKRAICEVISARADVPSLGLRNLKQVFEAEILEKVAFEAVSAIGAQKNDVVVYVRADGNCLQVTRSD